MNRTPVPSAHLPSRGLLACMLLALALPMATAQAAESYDNCTGFIDSVPTSISSRGTWCLRKDLGSSVASGALITVEANNITIDCNDFKLGGMSAGPATQTKGISAKLRSNLTVRNCMLRGFWAGIHVSGGVGHVVEDNRIDNSSAVGLWVDGDGSIVRNNRISETGGAAQGDVTGLIVQGDAIQVVDNMVNGVAGSPDAEGFAQGLLFNGTSGLVRGNFITGVLPNGGGAVGIKSDVGFLTVVEGNVLVNPVPTAGIGIDVNADPHRPVCLSNRVRNYSTSAYDTCVDGGGNFAD